MKSHKYVIPFYLQRLESLQILFKKIKSNDTLLTNNDKIKKILNEKYKFMLSSE